MTSFSKSRGRWRCSDVKRMPGEDGGRNWSDAAANQEMPRIAGNHRSQEKDMEQLSASAPSEEVALLPH